MPENKGNQEITQKKLPEIDQQRVKKFEQSTRHPADNNTEVQSEEIRYNNADKIYE
jgi:hypothetical protein